MQIRIKFPDVHGETDVQPFFTQNIERQLTEEEEKEREKALNTVCLFGKIEQIGYGAFGNPIISIEKKDGYLYVEIDERCIENVEKFQ